jgi:hypothetical protein
VQSRQTLCDEKKIYNHSIPFLTYLDAYSTAQKPVIKEAPEKERKTNTYAKKQNINNNSNFSLHLRTLRQVCRKSDIEVVQHYLLYFTVAVQYSELRNFVIESQKITGFFLSITGFVSNSHGFEHYGQRNYIFFCLTLFEFRRFRIIQTSLKSESK